MKVLGVVAEYDPFHSGHLYHLQQAKQQVSPDLTFVVLSPCLKQRGTLPLLSPADRARCALEAGADAVFALPVLWTVRDAEHYALGAVSLLSGLGVTHLAFGAETDHPELLSRIADILEDPTPELTALLKRSLAGGGSYPAAVSGAVSAFLPEAAAILDKPNNILAVCYLRALRKLDAPVQPVAVRRAGDYHAAGIDPLFPSASALREGLLRGNWQDALRAMPAFSADLVRQRFLEGRVPDETVLDHLLLSRLRSMTDQELAGLPDLSGGLENALRSAAAAARTRAELTAALTGKHCTAARVTRLCACALLGITAANQDALPLPDSTLLLGLRKNARMTSLWKTLPVRIFTYPLEWKKAAHPADLSAWSLWAQCCGLPDTLPFTEKTVSL